jgi:drug/metabolite transporter (DMT)-like permease
VNVGGERNPRIKSNKKGLVCIVVATLGYSIIPLLAEMSLSSGLSSATLLFYRFFFAGAAFFIYCTVLRKNIRISTGKEMLRICAAGVIYSVQCISFFSAFNYVSASLGEVIYHCYPLFTLVLAALFLKERITKWKVSGVVLSVIGTAVVLYAPWESAEVRGIVYVVVTAMVSSVYMVYVKRWLANVDTIKLTMYLCFICAAVYLCYSTIKGEFVVITTPKIIIYVSLLAFWSTVVGFFAFMKALSLLPVGQVSVLSLLEPLFTIMLAYLIFGAGLTKMQLTGTALILLAIFIYDR